MILLGRITLLYDGECGFCRKSLDVLAAFDYLRAIELIDANDRALVAARFPELPPLDFDSAMYAVDSRGAIYSGFDAFRAALWSSPVLALLAWTWYLPGVRAAGTRVYARVARTRRCAPRGLSANTR